MNKEARWLLEEKYAGEKSKGFFADLQRLQDGEPLAYIIGSIPFLNCTIHLDSHPLIPRTETEFWVEKAIEEIKSVAPKAPRILDLCAGSGAIGTAVAKAISEAYIEFGEIEKEHLSTIAKNLTENEISCTRYKIWQSDLFENTLGTFDFILTNPPYINPTIDRAETSVKMYEPHLALYGGKHGMEIIEKIISTASMHLNPNGQLWIEHEPEQSKHISQYAQRHNFAHTNCKDQYDVVRYSILTMA